MTKTNRFVATMLTFLVVPSMVVIAPNLAYAKSAPMAESSSNLSVTADTLERKLKRNNVWTLPKKCNDKQAIMLFKAGFNRPGMLRGAWAITWRESNHQSLGYDSRYFSGALGTWQIQTSAWSGKSWWSYENMMDKYTQSKIVRKHFLNGGMRHWGYGYSFKTDTWYEDAGMYYSLWGSSTTYAWVINPFNKAWENFPGKCTPVRL